MKDQEILQKLRSIFLECQQQALVLIKHHPLANHGFVADMQFASTYGTFLANIKMRHGIDLEANSIAQKLLHSIKKNDTHSISQIRTEIYQALDKIPTEQIASYIFLTCFPSIYESMMSEK